MSQPFDRAVAAQQRAFAAHLRDPSKNPPAGCESRRVEVYRELVRNNVEGFLANAFPVLRRLLGDGSFGQLAGDFIAAHACRSPRFVDIPAEFLDYLAEERGERDEDPPFLAELAHYEWVELALDIAVDTSKLSEVDPEGDLLDGVPLVSPLAWWLCYRWPVHRLSLDYRPEAPPSAPTWLIVWRDAAEVVRFMESNAATAALLAVIAENVDGSSGRTLLKSLAMQMQGVSPQALVSAGADLLQRLRVAGIIPGIRRTVGPL